MTNSNKTSFANHFHLQATEKRPDALMSTIPFMVTVSGVQTTTSTTTTTSTSTTNEETSTSTTTGETTTEDQGDCHSDLEKKYFISMVVLGAILGGLLTALFLILICFICKRWVIFKYV